MPSKGRWLNSCYFSWSFVFWLPAYLSWILQRQRSRTSHKILLKKEQKKKKKKKDALGTQFCFYKKKVSLNLQLASLCSVEILFHKANYTHIYIYKRISKSSQFKMDPFHSLCYKFRGVFKWCELLIQEIKS